MAELQKKQQALLSRTNTKALAQIVAIAAKYGITAADIVEEMKPGRSEKAKSRPARMHKKPAATTNKKVAPKFRNPANPAQTWTGRGISPKWVADLKAAGLLETALIHSA
ncbi:MAG: histone family protein nucleoid-structuring protein H-NS [Curvibacter sp. PD_MW3]|nr:MAG: histone family protein nucleoid-structuring protein H-NS [Curvibacter sp. PD_MW3]